MVQTYAVQDFELFVNKLDPKNVFILFYNTKTKSSFTISLFCLCNSTKPKLLYASA
jgi:hypothetical protein